MEKAAARSFILNRGIVTDTMPEISAPLSLVQLSVCVIHPWLVTESVAVWGAWVADRP